MVLAMISLSRGFTVLAWVINLAASIAGVFISLYMYISHEDLDYSMIEPAELSQNINTYLPIEFLLAQVCLVLNLVVAPWYMILLSLALAVYNCHRYIHKDHKLHFMVRKEYKKDKNRMMR